jgi:hypothetical protein
LIFVDDCNVFFLQLFSGAFYFIRDISTVPLHLSGCREKNPYRQAKADQGIPFSLLKGFAEDCGAMYSGPELEAFVPKRTRGGGVAVAPCPVQGGPAIAGEVHTAIEHCSKKCIIGFEFHFDG